MPLFSYEPEDKSHNHHQAILKNNNNKEMSDQLRYEQFRIFIFRVVYGERQGERERELWMESSNRNGDLCEISTSKKVGSCTPLLQICLKTGFPTWCSSHMLDLNRYNLRLHGLFLGMTASEVFDFEYLKANPQLLRIMFLCKQFLWKSGEWIPQSTNQPFLFSLSLSTHTQTHTPILV